MLPHSRGSLSSRPGQSPLLALSCAAIGIASQAVERNPGQLDRTGLGSAEHVRYEIARLLVVRTSSTRPPACNLLDETSRMPGGLHREVRPERFGRRDPRQPHLSARAREGRPGQLRRVNRVARQAPLLHRVWRPGVVAHLRRKLPRNRVRRARAVHPGPRQRTEERRFACQVQRSRERRIGRGRQPLPAPVPPIPCQCTPLVK